MTTAPFEPGPDPDVVPSTPEPMTPSGPQPIEPDPVAPGDPETQPAPGL